MKDWIHAARLRTLSLSISGIIVGSFIARWQLNTNSGGTWDLSVFILALLVTVLYQVLSNFANDYGDGIKGTDAKRVNEAEARAVASGRITPRQMKTAVWLTAGVSFAATVALLYIAFFPNHIRVFWGFIGLGILCILAAIGYTVGKKPYGYMGLGDIMVFLFFGLVSVGGSYFLFTKSWDWALLLPASAVGMMSAAVLNLNNMRDIESDRESGKKTLALRLGFRRAMIYQMVLLILPLVFILIFLGVKGFFYSRNYYAFMVMILLFPMMNLRRRIMAVKEPRALDPFLKQVGIITLMMAILLAFGLNYF
ncbi:1,4-dihydroxy-2-naphthoate octaprenyltransferase [Riemerella columbipharyngis]|uniref:1,4-dihydroxy-2-naphthoate octaprenyltransferase n=1 Tax=Riemerella columbipharyngis TaxID=1071918 RepID=A0A1G7BJG5_9FLAO|nr:1,4-dihydroxy-2-naphthoate octaprenyltransferase [Riemerella columbipharyngis]SDE27067.1 1,4-dihydroxy-2-naphthoate octaprenyltransferase [Riemerella columbipharyngis]